jgi:uncharacterized tellurite resistance protein B-like protein
MTLLAFALRLLAVTAFARAGGGGSFHSSGVSFHSSGGGYHSSGSSGYSSGYHSSGNDFIFNALFFVLQAWVRLCTEHPLFGLPITLVLAYFAYQLYNVGDDYRMARTISRGLEAQNDFALRDNYAALRKRDPAFEPVAFLKRVEAAFLAVQAAWSGQDMTPARALISDGVMERFTVQLAMQRALGVRNDMKNVAVTDAEVLGVESSAVWDVLHVRVEATAVDRDVALADGTVVRGSDETTPFEEVWTFVRRPTAKTLAGRGALEGLCPNCGAALQVVDSEQCGSCKSWLNSGEFDWVLCEITQASEWSARDGALDVPGFAALAEKDPALNEQFMEDRAAVAFWRWQEALWSGAVKALRPVASDALCAGVEKRSQAEPYYYRDAAIGAVISVAFETGGPTDRAHVIVRWSGELCERADGKETRHGSSYVETVLILERNAGVLTDARAGLRSLRCPACGAPPTARDVAACEYCAHLFNDGSRNWVLVKTEAASDWTVPDGALRRQPIAPVPLEPAAALSSAGAAAAPTLAAAAPPSAANSDDEYGWASSLSADAALRVMTSAMMADGKIEPEEQRYLIEFARTHGVSPETVSGLIDAAEGGRLELPTPQNQGEACAFLRGVVVMSLADGKVSSEERRAIDACAQSLSLTRVEVDDLIERERARLYEQAKAALARRRAAP